jgi:hypothetical protein
MDLYKEIEFYISPRTIKKSTFGFSESKNVKKLKLLSKIKVIVSFHILAIIYLSSVYFLVDKIPQFESFLSNVIVQSRIFMHTYVQSTVADITLFLFSILPVLIVTGILYKRSNKEVFRAECYLSNIDTELERTHGLKAESVKNLIKANTLAATIRDAEIKLGTEVMPKIRKYFEYKECSNFWALMNDTAALFRKVSNELKAHNEALDTYYTKLSHEKHTFPVIVSNEARASIVGILEEHKEICDILRQALNSRRFVDSLKSGRRTSDLKFFMKKSITATIEDELRNIDKMNYRGFLPLKKRPKNSSRGIVVPKKMTLKEALRFLR